MLISFKSEPKLKNEDKKSKVIEPFTLKFGISRNIYLGFEVFL